MVHDGDAEGVAVEGALDRGRGRRIPLSHLLTLALARPDPRLVLNASRAGRLRAWLRGGERVLTIQ